jgi:hypothetical protein
MEHMKTAEVMASNGAAHAGKKISKVMTSVFL